MKTSAKLEMLLFGDRIGAVNCLEPHPFLPVLATRSVHTPYPPSTVQQKGERPPLLEVRMGKGGETLVFLHVLCAIPRVREVVGRDAAGSFLVVWSAFFVFY